MTIKQFFFILMVSLAFLWTGCSKENKTALPPEALGPLDTATFNLGSVSVEIEIAFTPQEQMQGLMFRKSMPENHGMLFVYRQPRFLDFWMKNTLIPLDIAFIREDGTIGNIEAMKPQQGKLEPEERYHSRYKSLYALEMNQGWFEKQGIRAGDKIDLPREEIERIVAGKPSM